MNPFFCAIAVGGAALILQGCGGGDSPSPSPASGNWQFLGEGCCHNITHVGPMGKLWDGPWPPGGCRPKCEESSKECGWAVEFPNNAWCAILKNNQNCSSLDDKIGDCGSSGVGVKTYAWKPTPQTTHTTTTTTTLPSRTKPMTSQEAATYFNKLYLDFAQTDDTTQLGVTISMAANNSGFFANIFCSKFYNPAFRQFGGCYNGQTDCRMSASLLSHLWMIQSKSKAIASFGERRVGYVFNQTMVEQKWGKCSYIWDGATGNRYNRGCGDGAPSTKCGAGENSAYNNKCGSDKHTCTPEDDEVKRAICQDAGGARPVPPTHANHPECVFPGPAFGYHGQEDFKSGKDYTRVMAKQRMKYNNGEDEEGNNIVKNNEVVLDEELLMKDIWENPIAAIPAIIYTQSTNAGGTNRKLAEGVRDDLCAFFGCDKNGGGMIPLVKIDDTKYYRTGPFFADTGNSDFIIPI